MNKIPTLLAASLVALAAWAQPSTRVNDTKPSGNSPIRLAASKMAHNAKKDQPADSGLEEECSEACKGEEGSRRRTADNGTARRNTLQQPVC